jgi:hypothetical protein
MCQLYIVLTEGRNDENVEVCVRPSAGNVFVFGIFRKA